MNFIHPEILWALLVLLIPIIIHLFQLRRFRKTHFTNVHLLQKLQATSRKSAILKKWLLLFTRLGLLTALVLAFAQPYSSKTNTIQQPIELVVYVDNSFSMQANSTKGPLLVQAIQEILQFANPTNKFSLFTNTETFRNISVQGNRNDLLQIAYSPIQLKHEEIVLKGQQLFSQKNTQKRLLIISDMQERIAYQPDLNPKLQINWVRLIANKSNNYSIDTAWINTKNNKQQLELRFKSNSEDKQQIAVNVYENKQLLTKASIEIAKQASLAIDLPSKDVIQGHIEIEDDVLQYDNHLYFIREATPKIKTMIIYEDVLPNFLNKIYTKDEFDLKLLKLEEVQANSVIEQQTIVLFALDQLPLGIQSAIQTFTDNGGHLIIVPQNGNNENINRLLAQYRIAPLRLKKEDPVKITNIAFDHPFFKGVFENKIENFSYPEVKTYFSIPTKNDVIIQYQNGDPFLFKKENVYVYTANIHTENSNFTNSSLIVPIFYKIATDSYRTGQLYYSNNKKELLDIPLNDKSVEVIQLQKDSINYIPLQRINSRKIRLELHDFQHQGIFRVMGNELEIGAVALNHLRNESNLVYTDISSENAYNSIEEVLNTLKSENKLKNLWKWFVIFALVFLILEILVIKLFR